MHACNRICVECGVQYNISYVSQKRGDKALSYMCETVAFLNFVKWSNSILRARKQPAKLNVNFVYLAISCFSSES